MEPGAVCRAAGPGASAGHTPRRAGRLGQRVVAFGLRHILEGNRFANADVEVQRTESIFQVSHSRLRAPESC